MNLSTFDFNDQPVRVAVASDGEPWWIAADVCRVLSIANARAAVGALDEDERNTVAIGDGNRGNPNVNAVNESGLYSLIFRSRKPQARAFKKWVTSVVLPAIRRTGQYQGVATTDTLAEQVPVTEFARLEAVQAHLFRVMGQFATGRATPVDLNATTSWAARVFEGMDRTRRAQAHELHATAQTALGEPAWRRFFSSVLPILAVAPGSACMMVRTCWLKTADDVLPPDAFPESEGFGCALVKKRLAGDCQLRVLSAAQCAQYPRAFRVLFLAGQRLHELWRHRLLREGHALPAGLGDAAEVRRSCEPEPWFLSGECRQRFDGEGLWCWAVALDAFPFASEIAKATVKISEPDTQTASQT